VAYSEVSKLTVCVQVSARAVVVVSVDVDATYDTAVPVEGAVKTARTSLGRTCAILLRSEEFE
jgi:hypothetical protein